MKQKNIYIVLTRTTTVVSRLIAYMTGDQYTHASIALDKNLSAMYSFGRKQRYNPLVGGFCRENMDEGVFADCKRLPYAIAQIKVTPEQYDKVNSFIQSYVQNAAQYRYNYIGLLFAWIGKAYKCKQRFYCSEFVYDLLRQCEIIFEIDKLDTDETVNNLKAATALARQLREVVIPEVDAWTYLKMTENAGIVATPAAISAANVFDLIIQGSNAMDLAEIPDTGRLLLIDPDTWLALKKSRDLILETNIGNEMRLRGVIAQLDGMQIIRVPKNRVPAEFGFMLVHPSATVAPTKLADYKIHQDPPGISGSLVEGRINYDAFVLNNKAKGLYYQARS